MTDLSFSIATGKFTVRAAALIFRNDEVLLCQFESGIEEPFWFVPGGKVRAFESANEAAVREVKEELGEEISCDRLVWITESLVTTGVKPAQEIALYFEVKLSPASPLLEVTGLMPGIESGSNLSFRWIPRDQLSQFDIRPGFVKTCLMNNTLEFRHIVRRNEP